MLTCLLGWTTLQATDASIKEAHCRGRPQIDLEDDLVAYEPIFAFVYNNNAPERINMGTSGYRVKSPIIFNSTGAAAKIMYDSATGELVIPHTGNYEVTYSANATFNTRRMVLAINGKELSKSEQPLAFSTTTATIALPLLKGDRVSLVFPGTSRPSLDAFGGVGYSASLFIKKIQ
jgi:hypothetical protein